VRFDESSRSISSEKEWQRRNGVWRDYDSNEARKWVADSVARVQPLDIDNDIGSTRCEVRFYYRLSIRDKDNNNKDKCSTLLILLIPDEARDYSLFR